MSKEDAINPEDAANFFNHLELLYIILKMVYGNEKWVIKEV